MPAADLSQLKDIHLPETISNWPMAFGWWALLAVVLVLLCTSLYFWRQYQIKNANKKAALRLLNHQYEQFKASKDSQRFLQQVNQVLKRYCLKAFPEAIHLSGPAWTNFLINTSAKDAHATFFDQPTANAISQGIYQEHCQYDAHTLYQACTSWLKQNKPLTTENRINTQTGGSND